MHPVDKTLAVWQVGEETAFSQGQGVGKSGNTPEVSATFQSASNLTKLKDVITQNATISTSALPVSPAAILNTDASKQKRKNEAESPNHNLLSKWP